MKLFYRISDKSYEKAKLIGATKEVCLMNFVSVFRDEIFGKTLPPPEDYVSPMRIIADRCERKTMKMLADSGIPLTPTDKGNAGSFRVAFELALEGQDDDVVYFCEDDYLHRHNSPEIIMEGIKRAEYVTLYDHPDKYTRHYNGGEYSKVIKTKSTHWRYTASTCMTFASTVKTLREDKDVWMKYTEGDHPHDHFIFTELGKKGRRLAVPIPGYACHTDLTFSGAMNHVMMEPWAIEMMHSEMNERVMHEGFALFGDKYDDLERFWIDKLKPGWDKLVALDALLMDFKKRAQK